MKPQGEPVSSTSRNDEKKTRMGLEIVELLDRPHHGETNAKLCVLFDNHSV